MIQEVTIILWDEIAEEPAIHYETNKGQPILLDRDENDPKVTWSAISFQLGLDDSGDDSGPAWQYVGHANTARTTIMEGKSVRNHLCTVQIIW
jgi:hypothetical protein